MIVRRMRAAVGHRCVYGDPIAPGEVYEREIHPPWTPIRDDPDTPGVLGCWDSRAYHPACQALYGP